MDNYSISLQGFQYMYTPTTNESFSDELCFAVSILKCKHDCAWEVTQFLWNFSPFECFEMIFKGQRTVIFKGLRLQSWRTLPMNPERNREQKMCLTTDFKIHPFKFLPCTKFGPYWLFTSTKQKIDWRGFWSCNLRIKFSCTPPTELSSPKRGWSPYFVNIFCFGRQSEAIQPVTVI